VGRGQLQVLPDRVAAKRRIFDTYAQTLGDLPGITLMPEAPWGRCTHWLTCITVDPQAFGADREAIRVALDKADIESRPLWKPMHLQPVFQDCEVVTHPRPLPFDTLRAGSAREGRSVAEALFREGLCLPSGTALSEDDLMRVVNVIRRVS